MNTNIQLLRAKIVERKLTQGKVAALIGVDSTTFSRKMKTNGLSFSVKEMHRITEALQLNPDEAKAIFLCENSQK